MAMPTSNAASTALAQMSPEMKALVEETARTAAMSAVIQSTNEIAELKKCFKDFLLKMNPPPAPPPPAPPLPAPPLPPMVMHPPMAPMGTAEVAKSRDKAIAYYIKTTTMSEMKHTKKKLGIPASGKVLKKSDMFRIFRPFVERLQRDGVLADDWDSLPEVPSDFK